MSELILHHYAVSPFAEKIRVILGYKQLSYRSVDIPVVMPKPDLVALTGGYRKTPVLQIGCDVYCDTSLIARVLDAQFPERPVFRAKHAALEMAAARWFDRYLFLAAIGQLPLPLRPLPPTARP
jgi:glutathione S-transferase